MFAFSIVFQRVSCILFAFSIVGLNFFFVFSIVFLLGFCQLFAFSIVFLQVLAVLFAFFFGKKVAAERKKSAQKIKNEDCFFFTCFFPSKASFFQPRLLFFPAAAPFLLRPHGVEQNRRPARWAISSNHARCDREKVSFFGSS